MKSEFLKEGKGELTRSADRRLAKRHDHSEASIGKAQIEEHDFVVELDYTTLGLGIWSFTKVRLAHKPTTHFEQTTKY